MPDTVNNDIFQKTIAEFPLLKKYGINGKVSPDTSSSNVLEFWAPGEAGSDTTARPKEFPLDKPGVELYGDRAKTSDVAGDIVSHYLVEKDQTIKDYYQKFTGSITTEQKSILQAQYQWAKENEGEQRSFGDWVKNTGMPGYFRGYAFKQWPDEFNDKAYTSEQRKMFDEMMDYIKQTPDAEKTKRILNKNQENRQLLQQLGP